MAETSALEIAVTNVHGNNQGIDNGVLVCTSGNPIGSVDLQAKSPPPGPTGSVNENDRVVAAPTAMASIQNIREQVEDGLKGTWKCRNDTHFA